jgi:hypothetical protein
MDEERIKTYEGRVTFIPKCSKCKRYVKADEYVYTNDIIGLKDQPNATCKKCGRVKMIFLGFFE